MRDVLYPKGVFEESLFASGRRKALKSAT